MELKSQALDRVLDAVSPALAGELDRVIQETREKLEQEFQERLQGAVREAETATTEACAIQRDRAVAEAVAEAKEATRRQVDEAVTEAKETTRRQVSEALEQEFREKLTETTTKLSSEAAADRTKLQEQLDQWRVFAETQRQLAEASSQPEILSRFLMLAHPFADGLAVYVTKADGLALWKSRGKGAFPEIISQETTDPESYFRIITVRGKAVAAVCAAPSFKAEVLDFLTAALGRAIEGFGLRLRAPVPKTVHSETAVSPSSSATGGPADVSPDDQKA